jgi:hypothetical protein
MKKLIFFLLFAYSWTAQAQITAYSNATADNLRLIGGYTYFEYSFLNIATQNPYSLSGPSPQNDFTFVASSPQGFIGTGYINTRVPNQPITLTFKSNNVRKMSCIVSSPSENIQITATSNLGNTSTILGGGFNSSNFVGFDVQGENEYLTQVVFSAPTGVNISTRIDQLLIGDNTPQNAALNFDGINDRVEAHNSIGNFNTNDAFTVTCWVKVAASQISLANTDNDILEKWDGVAGAYPFVIRYINSGVNAGRILAQRYDGNILHTTVLISGSSINDGKWHHIAYVRQSDGYLKLYIDGSLSNSDPDLIQNTTLNNSSLYIGSRNNINHFKGEIDEVRIWTVGKTQTEIQNEMFCKNFNTSNLQAAFNFNNGSPNNDNTEIISVQNSAIANSSGILNNFAKTGDASNFVTGQIKYVKNDATGANNGSSWANAFTNLQTALTSTSCIDLFDIYVAKGVYKPSLNGDINASFNINGGMKLYGGFAGTEKNINERNMALLHSTNRTTLSGDLMGNDTPFSFTSNRNDNSINVVKIIGPYATFNGFTVRGGIQNGVLEDIFGDVKISNSKIIDNGAGLGLTGLNANIVECLIAGNQVYGVNIIGNSSNFQNCVIANNGLDGIYQFVLNTQQQNFINCTITANGGYGIRNGAINENGVISNIFKNTIIKDNAEGGILNSMPGVTNNTITYSLIQGQTSTANGNLNGNTVNPQFVSPLANNVKSDAGDYRLKDSSPCINVGTDADVSPLDLDRNPRPKGGKTDMGAYESNVNMNEIISKATGNWETTTTWNLERIPLLTDKVILNGHQVTVTTNTARAKDLEYKTGAILRYLAGGLLRFGL